MSSSTLFVRNKTDDFVGQVFITRENIPNKLIIVDYTRDPKVFSTSASISFSIKCVHPKFTGLTKFLHDRKKAAVVNIQVQSTVETESDIMYILPPDNVTLLSEARCLLNSDISQAAVAQVLTTVIAPTPTPSVPTASPTLPAAAAAAHGSSFLSNLLSKVLCCSPEQCGLHFSYPDLRMLCLLFIGQSHFTRWRQILVATS